MSGEVDSVPSATCLCLIALLGATPAVAADAAPAKPLLRVGVAVAASSDLAPPITLTGDVLPIGGLKEKALAAQRIGIRTVIAPRLNSEDAQDFPDHLRDRLELLWADRIDEVLDTALERRSRG